MKLFLNSLEFIYLPKNRGIKEKVVMRKEKEGRNSTFGG
jgi:hypothetical protein